jgi:hypothetical protein
MEEETPAIPRVRLGAQGLEVSRSINHLPFSFSLARMIQQL